MSKIAPRHAFARLAAVSLGISAALLGCGTDPAVTPDDEQSSSTSTQEDSRSGTGEDGDGEDIESDAGSSTDDSTASHSTDQAATDDDDSQGSDSSSTSEATNPSDSASGESDSSSDEPVDTSTSESDGSDGSGDPDPCDNILRATVRDMSIEHPDFEKFSGSAATTGLVNDELDADHKPVHAASGATSQTTGPANFAQWYHDVDGTNYRFERDLVLVETSPGVWRYDNSSFFPLGDDEGWGKEGLSRNFAFTTEIHLQFQYHPGQVFNFNGDDDLWLFVDGHLVLDLGGLHPPVAGSVDLDDVATDLGLKDGFNYRMDIFHAERHSTGSKFVIETSIGCIIPQ